MPDRADENTFFSAPILPVDKVEPTSSPTLSEVSPGDKPWDIHRANADRVADHYKSGEYSAYAQRVSQCSELLDFKLVPDSDQGAYRLKLSSARFCRVRHCPVCQWRRSLMWKARAFQALPKIIDEYPKYRWLFLTLTVKNCNVMDLKATIKHLNQSWQRFSQRKCFPAVGWLKSLEVTRSRNGSAHPHFHCLLLVKPSYFRGKDYIRQSEWCDLWQSALRVGYQPIIDIQSVKNSEKLIDLIPEILKYCVKESDLIKDRQWFLELTRQMDRVRCVSTGGILKDYLKSLEQEPEDLIGKDDSETTINEGHLYFKWIFEEKQYKMD